MTNTSFDMPVYMDCAATTPIDPRIFEVVQHYMQYDFGNAASHTHPYGNRAMKAIEKAREQIAAVVGARDDEVHFTSGATESNNIALLGLADAAQNSAKMHVVSSSIEHKAVLEPLGRLEEAGFEVTYVSPDESGRIQASDILAAVRDDTFIVSIMHVNNEIGTIQPLYEIAEGLEGHQAYFHTDAAQGFAKEDEQLSHPRIDMISASGHKLYAPKGVGALITRRRNYQLPPLTPLMLGGGHERGLRPGTLPVALCAGFGYACDFLRTEREKWWEQCASLRSSLCSALEPFNPTYNADLDYCLPSMINVSLDNIDSDAVMLILKDQVAISNGSACTTAGGDPSHVLSSMGLDRKRMRAATRWSWCHLTSEVPFEGIQDQLRMLA